MFGFVGAFSLFAASLGIVDYTSRLAADTIRTVYWRGGRESLIYAALVWAMVLVGCTIISSGLDQPLVLLVNLSGRGDKDLNHVYSIIGEEHIQPNNMAKRS